jgi:hypothetical protein
MHVAYVHAAPVLVLQLLLHAVERLLRALERRDDRRDARPVAEQPPHAPSRLAPLPLPQLRQLAQVVGLAVRVVLVQDLSKVRGSGSVVQVRICAGDLCKTRAGSVQDAVQDLCR